MKKILIDCRMYGMSGIGRYTENLIRQIINEEKVPFEISLVSYNNNLDKFKNYKNIKEIININIKPLSIKEIFIGTLFFKKMSKKYDLIHFTHTNIPFIVPKKSIITIHDLIPIILKKYFNKLKSLWLYFILNWNKNNFKKIISVSKSTKQDLINVFKIHNENIEIIYEKIMLDYNYSTERKIEKYFLYVGNRKKHKNLTTTIRVLDDIFDIYPNYKFYIVGRKFEEYDYIDKEISKCNNKENFIQLTNVNDEELYKIYKNAFLFIFLSEYEGFGIPPLEAFSFGVPTIASNNSSIKEVVKEGGVLVNEFCEKEIYETILKVIENDNFYKRLVKGTNKNFFRFKNYEEINFLFELYENIVNNK
ncbi:glycosyltransferase involved in cell wall biosynthesis [Oceanotoga teriensis]|uniref:Glycosyltransferase involved in cell wall biosynthesis n=1 Tax=Oceanotoga teriensis TaxID=515440 RepID=A0AA45C551_9BACT|nr:glycosyltransferase family 1 protein [Oceanotoga teriensis]PWJ88101.1 glycosyltransferase involved in cell wall biosynthesis [Oceanotoga teriensis]